MTDISATEAPLDLTCEERESDSPYIRTVWRSSGETARPFVSLAQSRWGLVVSKVHGKLSITFRGPETMATSAFVPADAAFVGVLFEKGTLMSLFPPRTIMDRADITLSESSQRSFRLNGSLWQFPDFENIETFVDRLVKEGLVLRDPTVADVLQGKPVAASLRTAQRRFLHATGMTHRCGVQIERARRAVAMLKQGMSTMEVVFSAGYFDQSHLIHSLKRFTGFTPGQITSSARKLPLSFLYNT